METRNYITKGECGQEGDRTPDEGISKRWKGNSEGSENEIKELQMTVDYFPDKIHLISFSSLNNHASSRCLSISCLRELVNIFNRNKGDGP